MVLKNFQNTVKRFAERIGEIRKSKLNSRFIAFSILGSLNPFSESVTKTNRHWVRQSISEVIEDADNCFLEENYLEVYERLNRFKYENNVDVQWRVCRALYKMSCDASLTNNVRDEMIYEAHDIISNAIRLEPDNPAVNKWMAVLTDSRAGLEGTIARIRSFNTVKMFLVQASKLDPTDISVFYMLGKWCFDMSNFTWWQRKVSSIFFVEPPRSTYEEAYEYFLHAEELKPRFYIPNLYMLGCTSFYLKQYYRARYYLTTAAQLIPHTEYEKQCTEQARMLANELKNFDISHEALGILEY